MYQSRFTVIGIVHWLKPPNNISFEKNRTKDFDKTIGPTKNIVEILCKQDLM